MQAANRQHGKWPSLDESRAGDLGNIPFYVDDLILDDLGATPTTRTTWGALKSRYMK